MIMSPIPDPNLLGQSLTGEVHLTINRYLGFAGMYPNFIIQLKTYYYVEPDWMPLAYIIEPD